MTNKSLSYLTDKIDINDYKECYGIDNNIILLKFDNYSYDNFDGYYLLIVYNGKRAGIIYNMDNDDLHIYLHESFRNIGIMSTIMRSGIINKAWPNFGNYITCTSPTEYFKTQHLAKLAKYEFCGPTNPDSIYYENDRAKGLVRVQKFNNINFDASLFREISGNIKYFNLRYELLTFEGTKHSIFAVEGDFGLSRLIVLENVTFFKDERSRRWMPVMMKVSHYVHGHKSYDKHYFIGDGRLEDIFRYLKNWLND